MPLHGLYSIIISFSRDTNDRYLHINTELFIHWLLVYRLVGGNLCAEDSSNVCDSFLNKIAF